MMRRRAAECSDRRVSPRDAQTARLKNRLERRRGRQGRGKGAGACSCSFMMDNRCAIRRDQRIRFMPSPASATKRVCAFAAATGGEYCRGGNGRCRIYLSISPPSSLQWSVRSGTRVSEAVLKQLRPRVRKPRAGRGRSPRSAAPVWCPYFPALRRKSPVRAGISTSAARSRSAIRTRRGGRSSGSDSPPEPSSTWSPNRTPKPEGTPRATSPG